MHALLNNLGPPKDIGDQPSFQATFRDEEDNLADPDTVTFHYRLPSGAETEYESTVAAEVTHPSTGIYRFTPPVQETPGKHYVRVEGTAGLIAASEGWYLVNRSSFTSP